MSCGKFKQSIRKMRESWPNIVCLPKFVVKKSLFVQGFHSIKRDFIADKTRLNLAIIKYTLLLSINKR